MRDYAKLAFVVVIVYVIIFGVFYTVAYQTMVRRYNEYIDGLITTISEEYPQIDVSELIYQLKHVQSKGILESYGYDLGREAVIFDKDIYTGMLFIGCGGIFVAFVLYSLIFIIYNRHKNKEISEITRCIQAINNRDYSIDLDELDEGELSVLRTEVYKTTLYLKELAENSIQDKINLKDSLSDISHQIKTPLTSAFIMIDSIIDNPDMDTSRRMSLVRAIKRELGNVNFMVQSLLKLAKFESNTITFTRMDTRIADIMDSVRHNIEALCDLSDVELIVEGEEDLSIECDRRWEIEAITNIVKNCIEHSSPGSSVKVRYYKDSVSVRIIITDEAGGIAKEDLPHIFERFYQSKKKSGSISSMGLADTSATGGSYGIGLSLAKVIIESDGGMITARTIEGGSCFTIIFQLSSALSESKDKQ